MHSIDQVISVDLLNSFLPEVWYSLVLGTGKRYRKEKTICQYSQISSGTSNVWGIRIGEQVCIYLKKHNAEYQRLQKKILEFTEKYPVIETFMETNQSISLTEEEHKAVHRYFQLESEKEMIEEEYHFYMGQAQMISYGAMLGKIKKAILGKDDGDTQKLLELLLDTWIDEIEEQLKENIAYQGMLEKISKYEEQVQTMGLAKEKRKTIDAYVTEVSERWILYAESLYQAGMQKILELLNL